MKKFLKIIKRVLISLLILLVMFVAFGAIINQCGAAEKHIAAASEEEKSAAPMRDRMKENKAVNNTTIHLDSENNIAVVAFPIVFQDFISAGGSIRNYHLYLSDYYPDIECSIGIILNTNIQSGQLGFSNASFSSLPNVNYTLYPGSPNTQFIAGITFNAPDYDYLDLMFSFRSIKPADTYLYFTMVFFTGSWSSDYAFNLSRSFLRYYDEGYNSGEAAGKEEGYQDGYTVGETAGKEEGYQDGLLKGTSLSRYGIFEGATVDGVFEYESGDTITANGLLPGLGNNTINFSNIADAYKFYSPGQQDNYLSDATITINLSIPWQWTYTSIFAAFGESRTDVQDIIFIDLVGNKFIFDFDYQDIRNGNYTWITKYPENSEAPIYKAKLITKLQLNFGRAMDTLGQYSLTLSDEGYFKGYNSGFFEGRLDGIKLGQEIGENKGREEGREEGYKEGYAAGTKDGEAQGYAAGTKDGEAQGYANAISEGVSQEGIFNGALSFVRIFFQLTTQLLDTKIVGDITFGLIIIGLPAVALILNLTAGFVKKLLGARGADE